MVTLAVPLAKMPLLPARAPELITVPSMKAMPMIVPVTLAPGATVT